MNSFKKVFLRPFAIGLLASLKLILLILILLAPFVLLADEGKGSGIVNFENFTPDFSNTSGGSLPHEKVVMRFNSNEGQAMYYLGNSKHFWLPSLKCIQYKKE